MATNRNIVIQYFNGTDYDQLYPQTQGTLAGLTTANSTAVASLTSTQVRNIYAGTTDMTQNSSILTPGDIYLVYET